MPLYANSTPFDVDVEKATDEQRTVEDWGLIIDICDKVKSSRTGPRDCLKSIVKRINHKVPWVAIQALTLLDLCVENCGRAFHLEMASPDFISECRTLLSADKANTKVLKKLRLLIQKWAQNEFKNDSSLDSIPSLYKSLKQEGADFSPEDLTKTIKVPAVSSDSGTASEQADIAKAIALSLQDAQKGAKNSSSLYPSVGNASSVSSQRVKEQRQVRAVYDFEAAEDNELTFKAGEIVNIIDDSDPNWWKGSNQRGEGLFPANFVTADLTAEPEEKVKERKTVQFNEEVQVKTVEAEPEDIVAIDEAKIDRALNLIQNADPTGEIRPDSPELLKLEEQCGGMLPLIDQAFERLDRKQNRMIELNKRLSDAMQMYHALMRETPMYGGYSNKYPPPPMVQQQQPDTTMYGGQLPYGMPQQQAFVSQQPYAMGQRAPLSQYAPSSQSYSPVPQSMNPGSAPQSLPPMMNSMNQTVVGGTIIPSQQQQLPYQSSQPDLSSFSSVPLSAYSSIPTIASQNNASPYHQPQQPVAFYPAAGYMPAFDQPQQLSYSPQHVVNAQLLG